MPQLKSLQLKSPGYTALDLATGFDSLQSIELEARGISSLEITSQGCKNLTDLRIQATQWSFSSTEVRSFDRLASLESLDLSGCGISVLPENFKNLNHLQTLRLNDNKLTQVDAIQEDFGQLALLELSGNRIQQSTLDRLDTLLPDCEVQFFGAPYSDLLTKDNKIVPPIPGLAPQPKTYSYQPNQTTEINTPSGYQFKLPAGSLVNGKGETHHEPCFHRNHRIQYGRRHCLKWNFQ